MYDDREIFTLTKLTGKIIPYDSVAVIEQMVHKNKEAPFNIGDVLLKLDIRMAMAYLEFLPESDEIIRRLMYRVIKPALFRTNKKLNEPKSEAVLQQVRNYITQQDYSVIELEKAAEDLLASDEYEDFHTISLYLISKILWSNEKTKIILAVDALLFFLNSSYRVTEEIAIKKDLLFAFAPMVVKYDTEQDVFYHQAIIRNKLNWFLKLIGFKRKDGKTYEFKWGSIKPEWGFRFEVIEFDDDCDYDNTWNMSLAFIFGNIWINLPKWLPRRSFDHEGQHSLRKWGFYFNDDKNLWISFGLKYKTIRLPWSDVHIRREHLMLDGTWQSSPKWDDPKRKDHENNIAKEIHSVQYRLENGQVQHRLATIDVEEMEWRMLWLKHIPIFRNIQRFVGIEFNDEVGERTGSWKGGTCGCSVKLLPNETPKEALRRKMKEKFR